MGAIFYKNPPKTTQKKPVSSFDKPSQTQPTEAFTASPVRAPSDTGGLPPFLKSPFLFASLIILFNISSIYRRLWVTFSSPETHSG
ncbi:hypothetical protein YC2023_053057 [Brassica napus]